MDYQERIEKVQQKMKDQEIDYLILTPGPNMVYLSGYDIELHEREFFLIVPAENKPFFFLNELIEQQVKEATSMELSIWKDNQDPEKVLSEVLDTEKSEILVEDRMPARFTIELREVFEDAEIALASDLMEDIRIRKTQEEKEKLIEAGKIADEVVEEVRSRKEEFLGKTENELADFIEEEMEKKGGEKPSFETVAASGSNGSKPHQSSGERKIEKGEPLVLDFGCFREHYPSDQTRTIVFGGEPSRKFREIHETVRKAQQKAVEKVKPGVKAKEVNSAAREVIEEAGYGEEFIHRTGHGVGLTVHEPPYINQTNERELEEGMVFSVEPGIYIEGEFGVRIEDLVIVTKDGCERLNNSERGWK